LARLHLIEPIGNSRCLDSLDLRCGVYEFGHCLAR
jgi:hypothetical protein